MLPRLDVGVWIFFVLSGLFICRPYVRAALGGTEPAPTRTYALRRLSRVYPLYWFVLGVSVLTEAGPRPPSGQLLADVLLLNVYVPAWAIGPTGRKFGEKKLNTEGASRGLWPRPLSASSR